MATSLAELIGDDGTDAVIAAMTDVRTLHLPGACRMPASDLFSADDLERLLLRDGLGDALRMSVNGHFVDMKLLGVTQAGRLRPLALRRMTRQGASLILMDVQRHHAGLWALACDAERRLQDRVKVGVVASFSRIPALRAHYDEWDLIIVQLEGAKTWRLIGDPVDCGTPDHKGVAVPNEVPVTVEMQPGDVLLVPAGQHHQCEAEGFSLHLALLVERATVRELLDDLLKRDPALNRPLRNVLGPDAVAADLESMQERLLAALEGVDIASWLADWNAARSKVTRLDLLGGAGGIAADDIASLAITLAPDGGAADQVKIAGATIDLTPAARALIRRLADGPQRVADLRAALADEFEGDQAEAMIDALAARGLIEIGRAPSREPAPLRSADSAAR